MRSKPQGGHFEAVAVPEKLGDEQYVPGEFIHYRHLDPVRAAALTAAVQVVAPNSRSMTPLEWQEATIDLADMFEAWLDPKEADGQD